MAKPENERELQERLIRVQADLKAPKNQYNSFGKYKYRSCEDIEAALKPLLLREGLVLTITDTVTQVGGQFGEKPTRYYLKATATVRYQDAFTSVTGLAREDETKKGMDGAQITGTASSYARKYALNGLFLIDDTRDSDATDTRERRKRAQRPADNLDGVRSAFTRYTKASGAEAGSAMRELCEAIGVDSLHGISDGKVAEAIAWLNSRIDAIGQTNGK